MKMLVNRISYQEDKLPDPPHIGDRRLEYGRPHPYVWKSSPCLTNATWVDRRLGSMVAMLRGGIWCSISPNVGSYYRSRMLSTIY